MFLSIFGLLVAVLVYAIATMEINFLGPWLRVLVEGIREAGAHEVVFDADGLPSGTYLYRLETPQGSFVRTMLLAK